MTDDGNGNKVRNTSDGAEGHTGIANLDQGGNGREDKNKRRALRSILADAAEISPVPVPHDIPEDHVRIAAYFISEKAEARHDQKLHWTLAVQQMRRARVNEARSSI